MKKLLILLMILSLSVALIACGGEVETGAPETDPVETQAPETDPPETQHVHEIEVEEILPTCSARGYHIETCKTCGETLVEQALPKTECTPNGDATCTTDSVCTACGKVLVAATGHVWTDKQTVVSTCTADGKETATCSVCGTVEETVIPMIDHIMGAVEEEKAATCTEAGYKKGACVMCNEAVVEELAAAHDFIMEAFRVAEDGSMMSTCYACGDIPVTEEVRVALNFDDEVEAELAAGAYGSHLRLVDSTKSSVYKKKNAVIGTNEERTVLAPKGAVSIDFDAELLDDARYYMVSFDYYITTMPAPDNPSDPLRATLFSFVPGFQNGAKASTTSQQWGNFTKYTFGTGWVYTQFGSVSDINGGAKVYVPNAGEWYALTYIVDNVEGVAYAYINGEFIASPKVPKGIFGVNAANNEKYEGYFSMIFADDYVKKYGAQFDNFKITVLR